MLPPGQNEHRTGLYCYRRNHGDSRIMVTDEAFHGREDRGADGSDRLGEVANSCLHAEPHR